MAFSINLGMGRDPANIVKVRQGESFTIPTTKQITSPTSEYLAKTMDSMRNVVGGSILATLNDAAGGDLGANPFPQVVLRPGDVIACSAVASNVITVTLNGTTIFTISGVTTFGAVLLVYG